MRRFLLDNDTSNLFACSPPGRVTEAIDRAVEDCPPEITTYLVCAGAGTFYYPTEVGRVCPLFPGFQAELEQGKDPLGYWLETLRRSGRETFITLRMNDVHNPTAESGWNTPTIRTSHPDAIVDPSALGKQVSGSFGEMAYCLDYGRPEVFKYMQSIVFELIDRYDVDGLQLDWLRWPRHLSGTVEEVWEKREVLTEFMIRVREQMRKKRPSALLAARIPTSPTGCRNLGIDVRAWTQRQLVDFVVATPFLTSDFSMPIGEIRELMEGVVPIYADIEFGHATQIHNPESIRATALGLYGSGADGIYVFNFPCWTEYLRAVPYHWLDDLATSEKAARKPLLFSVDHRDFRVPGIDLPWQLPLQIEAGDQQTITLPIPATAFPIRQLKFVVDATFVPDVALNGVDIETWDMPKSELAIPTYQRNLFVEHMDKDQFAAKQRPEEENWFFEVDPTLLKAGQNELLMRNRHNEPITIHRVNAGLW